MATSKTSIERILGAVASRHGFEAAYGGWIKRDQSSAVVLDLQRSNFGLYFDLNIKVFLRGASQASTRSEKSMVKREVGDVFRRPPNDYQKLFSMESDLDEEARTRGIEDMFDAFLVPFSEKALTRDGLLELASKGEVHLLPAIRKLLEGGA